MQGPPSASLLFKLPCLFLLLSFYGPVVCQSVPCLSNCCVPPQPPLAASQGNTSYGKTGSIFCLKSVLLPTSLAIPIFQCSKTWLITALLFQYLSKRFHKPSLFSYLKMHFHVRFLKMKSCALTIQRVWRATRAARMVRQQFLAMRSAAVKIQLAYRQYRARRLLRKVCFHLRSNMPWLF